MDYLPIVVYIGNLSQRLFDFPLIWGLSFFALVAGLCGIAIFTTMFGFFNK